MKEPELQPKVLTADDLEKQQQEAEASAEIAKAKGKDPYDDTATQQKLLAEFRALEAKAQQLANDRVALDALWKEVNEKAEAADARFGSSTISVARCYPMKNRFPDVLPYDSTRVELPTTKDDYINASHVRELSRHCPKFIATQAPAHNTLADFWTMVWQEQVETIACLLSEADLKDVYWPPDRKEPLKVGKDLEVTMQSTRVEKGRWTERIFTVMNKSLSTSRVIIHMELNDYR